MPASGDYVATDDSPATTDFKVATEDALTITNLIIEEAGAGRRTISAPPPDATQGQKRGPADDGNPAPQKKPAFIYAQGLTTNRRTPED